MQEPSATYVSEQISTISAIGICFDSHGIQYVTREKRQFPFPWITLRNLGTNMRFTGTGFKHIDAAISPKVLLHSR